MAPDSSMARSRSSKQLNPTAYTPDRISADSPPASVDAADSPSPPWSEASLDFPALSDPAAQALQEPVEHQEDFHFPAPMPSPPKAQRMSPTRVSRSPMAPPAPTYARTDCSPASCPPEAAVMQPSLLAQTPPWGDQWTSSTGLAYLVHGYATPRSQLLSPRLPPPEQPPTSPPQLQSYLQAMPTKEDFRQLVEDVKSTCRSEIQALQSGLKHLADRVEMTEEDIQETKLGVHRVQLQGADHRSLLRDMQRHVEDLDNRGRRNNIRVRGVPESDGPEDVRDSLQTVFNNLLGEPPAKHIEMDRAHRALRPKGATSKPRDIICRISSYPLKEEIMRQARLARKVMLHEVPVQLYPDLLWITLQKRRLLQPLLQALQEENIPYRWGFPFSLTAKHQGKSAALRYPEDLPAFCDVLGIPVPQLPEWDLVATPPPPPTTWQRVPSTNRPQSNGASRKAARHSNG